MTRTKNQILRDLDPADPASIRALIDFHRSVFGGYTMNAENGDGGGTDQGGGGGADSGQNDGDKPLGTNGEKALHTEREARKALEKELQQFKTTQAERDSKLAEAFGIKFDDAKSEDVVTTLQQRVQQMEHDNLVYRVITDPNHPVTDKDDVELIKAAPDEDRMRKLATRLTKKTDDAGSSGGTGSSGRRPPRPDDSQGRGGGDRPAGEQGRSEAERRFGKKQQ